jgi:hypothetical protein
MKLAIVLALVTFLQAAQPVPREAPENGGNSNNSQQDKSAAEKINPTAPTATGTPTESQEAAHQNAAHDDKPAVVRVFPVDVHKDFWDYSYIGASLIIAIATLIIAGTAWSQAKAALLSAQAVINADRAWVVLGEIALDTSVPKGLLGANHAVISGAHVVFKNCGKTPAWIVETSLKLTQAALQHPDIISDYEKGSVIEGGGYPLGPDQPLPIERKLSGHVKDVSDGATFFLYGFIKYRDVFSKTNSPLRESYICYKCSLTLIDILVNTESEWTPCGPTEANRYT